MSKHLHICLHDKLIQSQVADEYLTKIKYPKHYIGIDL